MEKYVQIVLLLILWLYIVYYVKYVSVFGKKKSILNNSIVVYSITFTWLWFIYWTGFYKTKCPVCDDVSHSDWSLLHLSSFSLSVIEETDDGDTPCYTVRFADDLNFVFH